MNRPNKTITFLFTDIEGSTKLWEEHPGPMRETLARHDTLLRQAIERRGGHVFKTMGDAVYAVFAVATDAVQAALDAQGALLAEDWGTVGTLRVRMALHTGRAEERDGDYLGPSLNRVARLLAIGHGGQVLVSEATQAQIRDADLAGASLGDMGSHRLKDLFAPEHVYQLCHPDLPQAFPPLRSLPPKRHNLPVQMTSLIGRTTEIEAVRERLAGAHLLTLTGSGGVGKTRLALQVAAELLEEYPDGVWLADLAALSDPLLVPQTAAQAVGAQEEPGRNLTETLADTLKEKRLLLILDNCEHLIDACAHLADRLLRACPEMKILATSREVLGIAGEMVYYVPSLSLPEQERTVTPDALSDYEAIRLFAERAATVAPSFAVTPGNAVAVAQVCQQLDGIPLAIELAAARVRVLSVEQVAQRLDDRFRLLTGGSRTALPRQQTLRALIDWSYDLLTEPEKRLLNRLAVFVGGWTLEAAEAVCSGVGNGVSGVGEPQLSMTPSVAQIEPKEQSGNSTPDPRYPTPEDVLDLLSSLVNKSLVICEAQESQDRYRLSETIRQYARDRLRESGEEKWARGRHRNYYLQTVETMQAAADVAAYRSWCAAERDNLRAALSFSLELPPDARIGLRLAIALWPFWRDGGDLGEGRAWLEAALRKDRRGRSRERMIALYAAAYLAMQQSDYAEARTLAEECLALTRDLGEEAWREHPLIVLGHVVADPARARAFMEERIAILRRTGNDALLAEALADLGHSLMAQGELAAARPRVEEALAVAARSGMPTTLEYAKGRMALLTRLAGDYEPSSALYADHLARCRERDDRLGAAFSLRDLGVVRMFLGDHAAAEAHLVEAIGIFQRVGNKLGLIRCLEGMAQLAAAQSDAGRAARLFAAAERLREVYGLPLPPVDRPDYAAVPDLHAALGEAAFGAAWTSGRAFSLEQAMDEALARFTSSQE